MTTTTEEEEDVGDEGGLEWLMLRFLPSPGLFLLALLALLAVPVAVPVALPVAVPVSVLVRCSFALFSTTLPLSHVWIDLRFIGLPFRSVRTRQGKENALDGLNWIGSK